MGIGLAVCKRLIKEGCDITIWDLSEQAIKQARKELSGNGTKVFFYACDVSNKKKVKELSARARKDMGRVDILINNAGFVRHGLFCDQPVENAVRQMDVNVNALFYTIREFLPEMIERNSGHIVNVSSATSISSSPGLAAYSASKWAVWGLTESLRLEVMEAEKDVNFTSVHPGNIATGMFEGFAINAFGRLFAPPVKDHDIIARGIVEKGLKKNRALVLRPRRLRFVIFLRGILPYSLLARLALKSGVGKCVQDFKGREGFIHCSEVEPGD